MSQRKQEGRRIGNVQLAALLQVQAALTQARSAVLPKPNARVIKALASL